MSNAANHSSGHVGLQRSNELLVGDSAMALNSNLHLIRGFQILGSVQSAHTRLLIEPIRLLWQLCRRGWWKETVYEFLLFIFIYMSSIIKTSLT